MRRATTSSDPLQRGYRYALTERSGRNFAAGFKPELAPKEMLSLGVFGGAYFDDLAALKEFPASWLRGAKLSNAPDPKLNYFGVRASQSRAEWAKKGWLSAHDPRGWVQWYFRYYLGRRIPAEDARQIRRWQMMVRHIAQIKRKCRAGDITCNPRQRQALLHWAYDSRRY